MKAYARLYTKAERTEKESSKMKFDKSNKVLIESMNQIEARAFVKFLESEIVRHKMDIDNATDLIYEVCFKYKIADLLEE